MAIHIHIHHHGSGNESEGLDKILDCVNALIAQGEYIMASQQQLAAGLAAVQAQVEKIGEETTATLQKVADLEAALEAGGGTTPEVDAAMEALKAQVQLVDDKVKDAPTPEA